MFQTVPYQHQPEADPLKRLVSAAIEALKGAPQEVCYPTDLDIANWKSRYREIDGLNARILYSIERRAGVYAILTLNFRNKWIVRYIGKTDADGSRQRIRSHVVWRNKDTKSGKYTASKFDDVQSTVVRNGRVAISFVEIEPSSLRHYVEDILLTHFSPEWNCHGVVDALGIHRSRCEWDT
jgi:hypothetical protein